MFKYLLFKYLLFQEKFKREFQMRLRLPCFKEKPQDVFGRELSGFESAKSEWTRASTIVNINGMKTIPTN